jgi:hypothetical protein
MKLLTNISISLGVTVLLLIFIELFTRIYFQRVFDTSNRFLDQRNLLTRAYPGILDQELGWSPRPSTSGKENIWGTKVTISKEGIRLNGFNEYIKDEPLILAVGDSLTFGDQVSDDETWPSYLEKYSKSRVINGGVFNYGIDQIFLRTESLFKKYKPQIIIFSFIPRDIDRAGQSMRAGLSKPYFNIVNGQLKLHNTHINIAENKIEYKIGSFKKYLGHSFFINEFMMKINPQYWLIGNDSDLEIKNKPVAVSCLILKKLKEILSKNNIKGIILAQYSHYNLYKNQSLKNMKEVLECASQMNLETLDLLPVLESVRAKNKKKYEGLFDTHMTSKGNSFVAKELNNFLKRTGFL